MQFDPLNPVLPLLQREKRKDKLSQILFTTLNTQKQFNSWSVDIDFYKACYTALSWQRALSINTPFHKNDGHPIFFRSIEDDVQTLAPSPPVCEEPVSTVPETPIVVSQVVDSMTPVPDIVAVLEPVVETVLSVTEPVVVETAPEPTAVTAVVPEPVVIPDTVSEPVPEPVVVPVKPPRRPIWG